MDALNRVIHVMRLAPQVLYPLNVSGEWGGQLTAPNQSAFHMIRQGECWLRLADGTVPLCLQAGDLVVVSNVADYELLGKPQASSVPIHELVQAYKQNSANTAETRLICGRFRLESKSLSPIHALLPPVIHIRSEAGQSPDWLTASIGFIFLELENQQPGYEAVISRLLDVMFVMVICHWIQSHPPQQNRAREGGWLAALYDPQIGEVLALMHRYPERDWTVQALADAVNMPRSTLAAQFSTMVGEAPIQYLTRWRMQLAVLMLEDYPHMVLEEIALQVGYTSSYAFSKAFKRFFGLSPSSYRAQS